MRSITGIETTASSKVPAFMAKLKVDWERIVWMRRGARQPER